MKNALQIRTVLEKPEQLADLVEKLAYRRYDSSYDDLVSTRNWKALKTSSTETYVNGTVTFDSAGDHTDMPFTTSLFFTCVKEEAGDYKMRWAVSLS